MDTIRRDNPRHQGDIGVGAAIAHFMANGYRVAVPLGESQPWNGLVKRFDPEAVEWLFVLTDDLDRYVIPTSAIRSTTTLNLGRRMGRYRIGRAQLRLPL